jgi:hypothetical protein
MAEKAVKDDAKTTPEVVTIDSSEEDEPLPPGEKKAVVKKPTPLNEASPLKEPQPMEVEEMNDALSRAINAFGDDRGLDEYSFEMEDFSQISLTEMDVATEHEDDKKLRAKALLAAALKKRQADGSAADGAEGSSGANKAKRTIYVRGFMDDPAQGSKLEIFRFFKQFGKVVSVNLGYSKEQGLQYTWAAVEFEDDNVIKDFVRTNLFMDGYPLHIVRKKDNWDQDSGLGKLNHLTWKHVYVTGLEEGEDQTDGIQKFFETKFGQVKKVDSRVVNGLSIFLVEFENAAICQKALKGGIHTYKHGEILLWPPYIYEDLCVRKQSIDQQMTAIQFLSEIPTRKLIYRCLIGKFNDQGDNKWIVIRGQLRGIAYRPPGAVVGCPQGVFGGFNYY